MILSKDYTGHPVLPPSKSTLALENVRKGRGTTRARKTTCVLLNLFLGGRGVSSKLTVTLRPQDKKRLKTKHLPSGAWDSQGGVLPLG